MQFEASVRATEQACGPALALSLYYTGETAAVRSPSSFTGKVTRVAASGEEAVVNVTVTYQLPDGPKSFATKVLAVRRVGQWWVATPGTLNVTRAMAGVSEAQLRETYRRQLAAAEIAHRQHRAGDLASSVVRDERNPCPSDHASSAADARGDVRVNDGMMLATQQPGDADLVAVRHSGDGDRLCFELRFGSGPPREASVEVGLRPGGGRVTVSWTSDGRVVGQAGTEDKPKAVEVAASRNGDSMTLRIPRAAFGDVGDTYRWAVELFVPMPSGHLAYVDLVPDDQTINPDGNGGYVDHYVLHPGS
jgi:hypothetical protein